MEQSRVYINAVPMAGRRGVGAGGMAAERGEDGQGAGNDPLGPRWEIPGPLGLWGWQAEKDSYVEYC